MSKDNQIAKDYTVTMESGCEMYNDALTDATKEIDSLDLRRSSRPKTSNGSYFDGHLPSNLKTYGASELGNLMTLMTVFADYVAGLRVRAKAEKQVAEEKLKLIKAKIRKTKSGNKEERDDATITDIRYVTANSELLTKLHSYEMVLAREEAARRDLKTLSRLIEAEKISFEGGRRESNVTRSNNYFNDNEERVGRRRPSKFRK